MLGNHSSSFSLEVIFSKAISISSACFDTFLTRLVFGLESRFSVFTALVLIFGWLSFSVELALDFSVRFLVFVIGPSLFFERLDDTFLRVVRTGASFDSEPELETLFVGLFLSDNSFSILHWRDCSLIQFLGFHPLCFIRSYV